MTQYATPLTHTKKPQNQDREHIYLIRYWTKSSRPGIRLAILQPIGLRREAQSAGKQLQENRPELHVLILHVPKTTADAYQQQSWPEAEKGPVQIW